MSDKVIDQQPKEVFHYFDQITRIPRPSKKEEKMIAYLQDFAKEQGLACEVDHAGNVLIRKGATPGYEDRESIALQCHMDMVCEKDKDVDFNFETDAIQTYVEDGWVHARGTTLGADDGIGDAVCLAILASDSIEHGPIECLFTRDEETGLTGAMEMAPDFIESKILINLDSEEEGEICIGCSGGKDTVAELEYERAYAYPELHYARIEVRGLHGGHSGSEIDKGYANAVKLLARLLFRLGNEVEYVLASIEGGNLDNAIPREAHAVIGVAPEDRDALAAFVNVFRTHLQDEYKVMEPGLRVELDTVETPDYCIDTDTANDLIFALVACPHGVIEMSREIDGLVQTSTNLASVKMQNEDEEDALMVVTSQRSSIDSQIDMVGDMVRATFEAIGAGVYEHSPYPGWEPNTDSQILKIACESYRALYDTDPKVYAIHAGLECGLFRQKRPELDMISVGPTMLYVHSPAERLEVASVGKFWDYILDILKRAPKAGK